MKNSFAFLIALSLCGACANSSNTPGQTSGQKTFVTETDGAPHSTIENFRDDQLFHFQLHEAAYKVKPSSESEIFLIAKLSQYKEKDWKEHKGNFSMEGFSHPLIPKIPAQKILDSSGVSHYSFDVSLTVKTLREASSLPYLNWALIDSDGNCIEAGQIKIAGGDSPEKMKGALEKNATEIIKASLIDSKIIDYYRMERGFFPPNGSGFRFTGIHQEFSEP